MLQIIALNFSLPESTNDAWVHALRFICTQRLTSLCTALKSRVLRSIRYVEWLLGRVSMKNSLKTHLAFASQPYVGWQYSGRQRRWGWNVWYVVMVMMATVEVEASSVDLPFKTWNTWTYRMYVGITPLLESCLCVFPFLLATKRNKKMCFND